MALFTTMAVLSGVAFVGYGVSCLVSPVMAREFERFDLARFRTLVGALEVGGGAGLLAGLWYLPLLCVAAVGLTVLMLLGVGVRVRLRDGVMLTLPALLLGVVNGYLAFEAWRRLIG
jgi:lysylphosphatidylglycerol synthetase-like protein (DUF2156 family)